MPGSSPELSVVIPVRNGLPFIKQALASALADDSIDVEVVISENFSTDGTPEWLDTLDDPRVRVVRASHPLSAAANWTNGCEQARAPWVKVLPADDFLPEGGLARQLAAARANPDASLIASRRRVVSHSGRVIIGKHGMRGFVGRMPGADAVRKAVLAAENPFGEPSSVLFKRDDLVASLPFSDDHPYLTDLAMYVKVLPHGEFVGLASVDGAFRLNNSSWSAEIGNRQYREFRDWVDAMEEQGVVEMSGWTRFIVRAKLRANFLARRAITTVTSLLGRR